MAERSWAKLEFIVVDTGGIDGTEEDRAEDG